MKHFENVRKFVLDRLKSVPSFPGLLYLCFDIFGQKKRVCDYIITRSLFQLAVSETYLQVVYHTDGSSLAVQAFSTTMKVENELSLPFRKRKFDGSCIKIIEVPVLSKLILDIFVRLHVM